MNYICFTVDTGSQIIETIVSSLTAAILGGTLVSFLSVMFPSTLTKPLSECSPPLHPYRSVMDGSLNIEANIEVELE